MAWNNLNKHSDDLMTWNTLLSFENKHPKIPLFSHIAKSSRRYAYIIWLLFGHTGQTFDTICVWYELIGSSLRDNTVLFLFGFFVCFFQFQDCVRVLNTSEKSQENHRGQRSTFMFNIVVFDLRKQSHQCSYYFRMLIMCVTFIN